MPYLNLGVPKRMHISMGVMLPNKGLSVGVLGSEHSSVMRVSKASMSTSLLLYLVLCTTQERRNVYGIVFNPQLTYNLSICLYLSLSCTFSLQTLDAI